ncbi:hypothetical protein [Liquorilactobacillus ghanensis]|nr:hypothetical protein [Liquorilactobacillus ghanensis]
MKHGAKVVFNSKGEMILKSRLSNRDLSALIRLAAKLILEDSDSKFTVE